MPSANGITADELVFTGRVDLYGWNFRETAGSTAVINIYDNTSASGTLLATVSLGANGSAGEYYPEPITAKTGVYVDVTGTVVGSVYL